MDFCNGTEQGRQGLKAEHALVPEIDIDELEPLVFVLEDIHNALFLFDEMNNSNINGLRKTEGVSWRQVVSRYHTMQSLLSLIYQRLGDTVKELSGMIDRYYAVLKEYAPSAAGPEA